MRQFLPRAACLIVLAVEFRALAVEIQRLSLDRRRFLRIAQSERSRQRHPLPLGRNELADLVDLIFRRTM
jgi:hypothetical protein